MEIVWYGLSCFRLTERGMASVVTDPYSPQVGLQSLKLRADVVTVSHDAPGHNYIKAVKGARKIITGPGEYEVGGVFITGLSMKPGRSKSENATPNTMYLFDFDGVTVAHLGDLAHVPSQAQIENLGAVNIALIPVGGGSALSPSQAAEVLSLIEPSVVIPMHYRTSKEKVDLAGVEGFLSQMGLSDLEALPSLKVSKSGLGEETQVVLLQPQVKDG